MGCINLILFSPIALERTSPATALEWNCQASPQAGFPGKLQLLKKTFFLMDKGSNQGKMDSSFLRDQGPTFLENITTRWRVMDGSFLRLTGYFLMAKQFMSSSGIAHDTYRLTSGHT